MTKRDLYTKILLFYYFIESKTFCFQEKMTPKVLHKDVGTDKTKSFCFVVKYSW